VFAPLPPEKLLRQTMEIISAFYCDHRLLVAGLLWMNDTPFTEDSDRITADFNGRQMSFLFEPVEGISRLADVRF